MIDVDDGRCHRWRAERRNADLNGDLAEKAGSSRLPDAGSFLFNGVDADATDVTDTAGSAPCGWNDLSRGPSKTLKSLKVGVGSKGFSRGQTP